jgi:hypothetical protein
LDAEEDNSDDDTIAKKAKKEKLAELGQLTLVQRTAAKRGNE